MYSRQDVGWSKFSSVPSGGFSSGVAIGTNNNSVIYFAPEQAPFVSMYHPDNDTFSRVNIDAIENSQVEWYGEFGMGYSRHDIGKYSAAVFAPRNGNIYFIPYNTVQVGVLNIQTNMFSVILQPLMWEYRRYSGGVLSQDGSKIYMIPFDQPHIGVVDVNTHTMTTISILAATRKKSILEVFWPEMAKHSWFLDCRCDILVCWIQQLVISFQKLTSAVSLFLLIIGGTPSIAWSSVKTS